MAEETGTKVAVINVAGTIAVAAIGAIGGWIANDAVGSPMEKQCASLSRQYIDYHKAQNSENLNMRSWINIHMQKIGCFDIIETKQ